MFLRLFILFQIVKHTNAELTRMDPPSSCDTIEQNMCFKNKGYNLTTAASASECCNDCQQSDQCASWTWLGKGHRECHLKATVPTEDERQTCQGVSSIIRESPPKPSLPSGVQNIVLIVVDDLRPELGSGTPYNQMEVLTPRLDEFASTSLTFTQAYCQFSHCSPSRNSFLSGRGPQTTGVYNFIDTFREGAGENWTALPQVRSISYVLPSVVLTCAHTHTHIVTPTRPPTQHPHPHTYKAHQSPPFPNTHNMHTYPPTHPTHHTHTSIS